MKKKFYVDLYPGIGHQHLTAYTNPLVKIEGAHRFVFEVDLPDPYFPDDQTIASYPKEAPDAKAND